MVTDLCDIETVKFYAGITNDTNDARISQMISELSKDIFAVSVDKTITIETYDAERACLYGVLLWLEAEKIITSTKNVSNIREGDLSITYESGTNTATVTPGDRETKFKQHLAMLKPAPLPGVLIDLDEAPYVLINKWPWEGFD